MTPRTSSGASRTSWTPTRRSTKFGLVVLASRDHGRPRPAAVADRPGHHAGPGQLAGVARPTGSARCAPSCWPSAPRGSSPGSPGPSSSSTSAGISSQGLSAPLLDQRLHHGGDRRPGLDHRRGSRARSTSPWSRRQSPTWQLLGTGAGVLVVLILFPEGLGGLLFTGRDWAAAPGGQGQGPVAPRRRTGPRRWWGSGADPMPPRRTRPGSPAPSPRARMPGATPLAHDGRAAPGSTRGPRAPRRRAAARRVPAAPTPAPRAVARPS